MFDKGEWRTISDRLGSRWCCSWKVALALVVVGLLVTTGWGASSRGELSVGEYLLVEILADAAAGAVLLVASVTVMRRREGRRVPLGVVVAAWFVIGMTRGLVLSRFYLEDAAQVVSAAVSLTAWALLMIFLAATFSEERERAGRVQAANAELRDIRQSMTRSLEEERARLIAAVRDAVAPEIARLRALLTQLDRPGSTAEITALANAVADYSTGVVRRTSHELRGDESLPLTRTIARDATVRPAGVLVSYARAPQPVVVPMALVTIKAISVWISQDDAAILVGLIGLGVVSALALVCRSLVDRMISRPSWAELLSTTIMIVAMAGALAALFPWARGGESGSEHIPPAITFVFILTVLVAARLVAAFELRWVGQTRELAAVNADLERANEDLRQEVFAVRDQLAGILHGPVQGRLAAASMTLRMYVDAREAGEEADLTASLTTAATLLDRAHVDIERLGRPKTPESITDGCADIARNWKGLLNIEWTFEDQWPRSPEFTDLCLDVVSELVTNASRHGDARRMMISCCGLDADHVLITAEDDGSGPPPEVIEGQGLASVRRWNGTWQMAPGDEGGTRVTVTLRHPSGIYVESAPGISSA